jgi:hypothetical protein
MWGLNKGSYNKHDASHPVVFHIEQITCVQSNAKHFSFSQLNCPDRVPSGMLVQGTYNKKIYEGPKGNLIE